MSQHPRLLEVRQNVLKQNDVAARALRARFHDAGTFVISLVSSPGAGKTLEKNWVNTSWIPHEAEIVVIRNRASAPER